MKRTSGSQTKRTSILTLALFSFIVLTHAQWTEQTSGVTSFLTGVHFTDTTYGWVSGTAGTILHTTNAGAWWEVQDANTTKDLRAVFFCNRDSGWVVGDESTILFTSDGGENWVAQHLIDSASINFKTIAYHGGRAMVAGQGGQVYYTTNYGSTWNKGAKRDGNIESLLMLTDMIGWTAGQNTKVVHKITDGGNNIQLMKTDDTHYDQHAIAVYGNTIITGGGWGSLIYSNNGGTSWNSSSIGSGSSIVHALHLFDEKEALLLYRDVLFESSDSCQTWDTLFSVGAGSYFDLFALDKNHIWFVGSSGRIFSSFEPSVYVGTNELIKEHVDIHFSIAPVPAKSGETINLSIVSDKQQKATVQLFNLAGVLVMSEAINLTPANNVYTFSLPQGLYICRVMVGDKSFAERLVVL